MTIVLEDMFLDFTTDAMDLLLNYEYILLNVLGMLFLIGFSAYAIRHFPMKSYIRFIYLAGIPIVFVLGARLMALLFFTGLNNFKFSTSIFTLSNFSLYGGLLFFVIYMAVFARYVDIPRWNWLDAQTPGLLAYVIPGKIGCYLNGCCFGTPTILPWGVPYTEGSRAYQYYIVDALQNLDFQKWQVYSDLIHPVQLYESILAFLLLIIAVVLLKRKVMPGSVFLVAAGFYSLGRLGLFYLRAAPYGAPLYHFFPWLYLAISVISLGMLLIKLMKANELSI